MKRIKKGEFGYIKFQRKFEICKTILMLVLSLAIYRLGIYSTGSNENLLTFVAVLGCLPMAKFAVNSVMFSKAKGCSKEVYEEITKRNITPSFYDMFFTTSKKNFQISVLEYKKKTLIMLSEDPNIDITETEDHVKTVVANCGYKDITVKLYTDKAKFIERLTELNNLEKEDNDNTVLYDNLLSVTI